MTATTEDTLREQAGSPSPAIVAAAWGVGLVMNVWDVYGRRPIGEAEVEREMQRLRRN